MERLLLPLLVLLLAAGCAGGEPRSEEEARSAPAGDRDRVVTAPALGLWSHTFVRLGGGDVVAVGFSRTPDGVGLVRYSPDGRVDPGFSRRVWPEFGAGLLGALAAVRQDDDRIVVAACQPPDCWGHIVLARFHADGRLDAGFGENGFVRTQLPDAHLTLQAIATQPDGKIVVAGYAQLVRYRSFVARYHEDGRLDDDFGRGGIVTLELRRVDALLVEPDGRILLGGGGSVLRLLPGGDVDATFGRAGAAAPGLSVSALLVQTDGKIVAGGWGGDRRSPVFAVARLTPGGDLDRSFAEGGRLLHRRAGDRWARVEALLPRTDGRVVAVGWATRGGAVRERGYRFVFLLVTASGRLDPRFGAGGRRTLASPAGLALAAFTVAPDRLLAVGPGDDLEPKHVAFAEVALP